MTGRLHLLLAAALAAVALAACAKSAAPSSPPAQCERPAAPTEVIGIGLLESSREVPASFETAGRIESLLFDEGMRVRKGELLGTLDPVTPARRLALAEADTALARASIAHAEADLGRARANRQGGARELARTDALVATNSSTPAQRDAAADRLAVAEAELRGAEAGLQQARLSERASVESAGLQRQALSDTRLVSPMDAVVVKRYREPGHFVAAGAPVFTLASTAKLWVRAWVDETALAAVQPGQLARIEFRSQPGRDYAGRVDRIARQADRQVHEVLVDVEVLELPARYAFGERADVRIATSPAAPSPSAEGHLARAGAVP